MKIPAIPQSSWPYTRACYLAVALGIVTLAVLTMLSPASGSGQYHFTSTAMNILRLTVIIPIAVAWVMGANGATAFKAYAGMIKGSPEASAISLIADGLLLTVLFFVVSGLIGSALPFYQHSAGYEVMVVLHDHVGSLFSLVVFFVLYRGSNQLHKVARFQTWTRSSAWVLIAFAVFSIVFVLLFTSYQATSSSAGSSNSLAFISSNILLVTLILPYLAGWFMGVLTCVNISKFAGQVKGTIYRQALRDVVRGLWVVIILSMVIQIITFASRYLEGMTLDTSLLLLYALLVLYGLGFVFVRQGAKKLAHLEVVQ